MNTESPQSWKERARAFWETLSPTAALVFFFAVTFPFWSNAYLSAPDSGSYYAVARSMVRDADLDLANDYEALNFRSYYVYLSETDRISNDWPIGAGLVYLPGVAAGEIIARAADALGVEGKQYTREDRQTRPLFPPPLTAGWNDPLFAPTGQSGVYKLCVTLLAAALCIGGLRLGMALARPFSGKGPALAAAFVILLGTPLGFYTYAHAMMAHVPSMLAVGGLIGLWHTTRSRRTARDWILLGALAGLAVLVRPQNAGFLVVFLVELAFNPPSTRRAALRWLRGAAIAAAVALIVFSPQVIVWWRLYGNPLALPKIEEMHWFSPRLLSVLFSEYHGLLSWSPVLMLVPLGLAVLWRRDRVLAASLAVAIVIQWYVNAANEIWWASGSFGARRFLNCSVPFLMAIAAVLGRWRVVYTAPVGILLAGWNFLLWASERAGSLSLERYEPWDAPFFLETARMLNPARLIPGMMGDFAGFGWGMRLVVLAAGASLAVAFQKGIVRTGRRPRRILAALGLAYLLAMPPFVLIAAMRTGTHEPGDFPFEVSRRNQSLFLSYNEYGYFNLRKERWEEARRAYEKAAALLPSSPQAWRYLGTLTLYQDNEPEQALVYTGKALDLEPGYGPALDVELEAIQRLFNDDPTRIPLLERAARRLRAAGREEKAREVEQTLENLRSSTP